MTSSCNWTSLLEFSVKNDSVSDRKTKDVGWRHRTPMSREGKTICKFGRNHSVNPRHVLPFQTILYLAVLPVYGPGLAPSLRTVEIWYLELWVYDSVTGGADTL